MLVTSAVLLLLLPDPSLSTQEVHQWPPDSVRRPGESAHFSCSHSISDYDRVFWYKQTEDGAFVCLGYLNVNFPNVEPTFEENVSMGGDGRSNGTLTVWKVSERDAAVYFCAAGRHNAACRCSPAQKPAAASYCHHETSQHL
ncbi:hypothetical protein GN956_G26043 [Arapaima gigas]